jgi:hemerythrin
VRLRIREIASQQADRAAAMGLVRELHGWIEEHLERWDSRLGAYLNLEGIT